MKRTISLLVTMALLCLVTYPADDNATNPVHAGAAGKRAFDLLGAIYGEGTEAARRQLDAAVNEGLKELATADRAKVDTAAEFLLALFQQSASDERNGRAEWKSIGAWGGGSVSSAREFRKDLAEKVKEMAQGQGAVPMALWLLREDSAPASTSAAVEVLRRTRGDEADTALASLVAEGVHLRPALVMALEQTAARKLAVKREALQRWTRDPRESVRAAAITAGKALGFVPSAAFRVKDGFGPQTAKLLRDIASLLPEPIARDSEFGRFDVDYRYRDDKKPYRSMFIGWRLAKSPDETRAVSWHGEFRAVKTDEKSRITVAFTSLKAAGQVAEIARLRGAKGEDARGDLMKLLSPQGTLTGQFQSPHFTAPEALLSAWLFDKGDLAAAGALLFPRLDAMDDDRWPLQIVRDLIGHQTHQRMLDAFSRERDYAETLRLARHLSQMVFDGYRYQERAKELAAQLPGRMDDFKTFVLPTPAEWKELAAPMNRSQQIEFLLARLRLLNCHQTSQPGDVDYSDEQVRDGSILFAVNADAKPPVVAINPWNELRALKLRPGDVAALAPFLKDDNYLPTYSYWRDFHPGRTLHRVNWLVAALVNDAAKLELADLHNWQDLTAERREKQIAKIIAWSREVAGKPTSELLVANMAAAQTDREWLRAAHEAARLKDPTTLPALLDGAKKYPAREAEIASLCRTHGAAGAAESARHWVKSKDDGTRLHGALILLRHGSEAEKSDALSVLRGLFAQKWNDELHLAAVEPIIDSGDPTAIDLACSLLRLKELDWRWSGREVAHRLFLSRRPAALEALLAALADTSGAEEEQCTWEGKKVSRKLTRADRAAAAISLFQKAADFSTSAPDATRAKKRIAMAKWLKTQAELLAEGKPTPELDTEIHPIFVPRFQLDAP